MVGRREEVRMEGRREEVRMEGRREEVKREERREEKRDGAYCERRCGFTALLGLMSQS